MFPQEPSARRRRTVIDEIGACPRMEVILGRWVDERCGMVISPELCQRVIQEIDHGKRPNWNCRRPLVLQVVAHRQKLDVVDPTPTVDEQLGGEDG
jgi:hypothetical protein